MHASFSGLPDAFVRLAPELAELDWPDEVFASCTACAMVDRDASARRGVPRFLDATRCCTYRPVIPSFSAGRALREGGIAGELLASRIRTGNAHSAGVRDPDDVMARASTRPRAAFGQEIDHRCPYWVGGELACGVWGHRNGVCRTWFCKHADGPRGALAWQATRDLLVLLETRIAAWLATTAEMPEVATPEQWMTYYLYCAERLDGASDEELRRAVGDALPQRRAALREALVQVGEPMPDRVQANVRDLWDTDADRVYLVGYSRYDGAELPRTVFVFLSKLDGTRDWRDALAHAEAELGVTLGEPWVRELWRQGLLMPWHDGPEGDEEVALQFDGEPVIGRVSFVRARRS